MSIIPAGDDRKAMAVAAPMDHVAFEPRNILRVVFEYRHIILATGVLGLLCGVAMALMTTPRYRATALLDYDPGATASLEQTGARSVAKPSVANQEMMATQLGLLRSETLARRVAQDLNLASRPDFGGSAPRLENRIKRATAIVQGGTMVALVPNSLLFRVTYSSPDPVMAARVANGLANGFIAISIERHYDSSSYAREFLRGQLARTKRALEESESAVNDYTIKAGLFRNPGQVVDGKQMEGTTLASDDLRSLEEALNQARVKRTLAESAYRAGATEQMPQNAAAVTSLQQQRSALQAEYAQKAKLFKPDYPEMQALDAQIAKLDSEIRAQRGQGQGQQTRDLRAAYEAAAHAEQKLAAQIAQVKGQVQSERSRDIRYNILQREVDTNRSLYDALLQRYKEIGVAGGISQSNVSLVDAADVPGAPYSPRLVLDCIVGFTLGLLFGAGAAFAFHFVLDIIIDPGDVREKLRLRVLGVIPITRGGYSPAEALADRKSDVTEAYYSTLTAIKSLRPPGKPYTLFVTSSRPAEGKSTSAFAIAISTARLGGRVLLIDADLRRPTLAVARQDAHGLAHLLVSQDPVRDYIQPTRLENLSVLPVGPFSGSPAELLSSPRLPVVIAEAQHGFDLVVVDGPPVLGLTDAPLLSSVADSTVVVIESRKTRTASAMDMVRRLREADGRLLGVILTKVTRDSAGYGYNYYSYQPAGASKTRFDPEQITS